ncbi:hypothetical protein WT81_33410 [Burkholderia stagnalis]|nr:hypothetical protein WT80_00765 [Burkholderia stagnalis]KWK65193.1 hypothetical protein WT81_33410 [Burkholderia stagnalis]KWN76518.1 hypothetical protein WT90_00650 [Burkholderia stagnalis]
MRAARVEVFERVRESGARADWLINATPIGDDNVEWPEYAEWAISEDPEALIELVLPAGVFAAGVFVHVDELDDDEQEDGE